jgi:hypothetical protein
MIVCENEDGRQIGEYLFGIVSLVNKKELLQEGDPVTFQVIFCYSSLTICIELGFSYVSVQQR